MKVKVLGCSGGIGGESRTTSLLIDDDILIDGGTGAGSLELDELARINHVFVTHSHLDHIACIPLLVDSVGRMRDTPITVHATHATLAALRGHIFNWEIWPDFSRIPDATNPFMRYHPVSIGKAVHLEGRKITPIPAEHVVPAVGYHLEGKEGSLVYTGDTASHEPLWEYINQVENLRYLLIESAFAESDHDIAVVSKHLCPSMLADELHKLKRPAEIFVTHLKPGSVQQTMNELQEKVRDWPLHALKNGDIFNF